MSDNHKWYVIHVYSGFESKIVESIVEQAEKKGIEEQFSELMVPAEEVVEVRRGKKYNTERKFFPGYILAKMELSDEAWNLVKNTQRVTGFLGGQGRPVPISEREAADHAVDAGRRGEAASVHHLRSRRERPRHRRRFHLLRWCGRGSRSRKGASRLRVDLWPRDPVELDYSQVERPSHPVQPSKSSFCNGLVQG